MEPSDAADVLRAENPVAADVDRAHAGQRAGFDRNRIADGLAFEIDLDLGRADVGKDIAVERKNGIKAKLSRLRYGSAPRIGSLVFYQATTLQTQQDV